MNVNIRPARAEDYPHVERILRQALQLHADMRPDICRSVETAMEQEEFSALLSQDAAFAAEREAGVVGVMCLEYRHIRTAHHVPRDVIFVDCLAVDEPWRGMGVGSAFVDFLRALKAEKGLDGIELQVNARNGRAMEMYRKLGFTPKSVNMELLE